MNCSYLYKYYDKLFNDSDFFFFGFMVGNIVEYVYLLYGMLLLCFVFFFMVMFCMICFDLKVPKIIGIVWMYYKCLRMF